MQGCPNSQLLHALFLREFFRGGVFGITGVGFGGEDASSPSRNLEEDWLPDREGCQLDKDHRGSAKHHPLLRNSGEELGS